MLKRKHVVGLGITILSVLVIIILQAAGIFDFLNYRVYDFCFRTRGPLSGWAARQDNSADSLDVVLIDVDDETYRLIEGWPYPRGKVWNRVIMNLANAGAKVIAFDVQFDSRDSYTTKVMEVFNNRLPQGYFDGDVQFAEAIEYAQQKGTRVVLSSTIKMEPTRIPPQMLVKPNDYIMAAGPELGLVDDYLDQDGFTRRYPIFGVMQHEPDKWYLSLGMKAIMAYLDMDTNAEIYYDREKEEYTFGDLRIPSYGKDTQFFLVNWYGPSSQARLDGSTDPWCTFRRFPLSNIVDTQDFDLAGEDTDWMDNFDPNSSFNQMIAMLNPDYVVPSSPFKNKICIIGVSVEVLHDYNKTPFYNYLGKTTLLPGFEYHANAIQTVLDRNYIKVAGGTLEFSRDSVLTLVWITLLSALIAYLLIRFLEPLWGGLLVALEIMVYLSISVGLFLNDALWLIKLIVGNADKIHLPAIGASLVVPVIPPIGAIAITYLSNVLYNFILERRDKQFLKSTFGTYISPELIDQMYETKQKPKLGGAENYHTAFFSDIQGFSTFSEQLSASKVVELLNDYLSAMTDILLANKGTLDKYIGDAIVAFWGAPVPVENHEYYACLTALQMQEKLGELREKWQADGDKWPEGVRNLRMRIGVASGRMVTGNMGSHVRMNYTLMGDMVNTTARLESSAKQYGIYIQVLETTYQKVGDKFVWRDLDYVKVKGKNIPVQVYELLAEAGQARPEDQKLLEVFDRARALYRERKWDEAIEAFREADSLEDMFPGRAINPSRIYIGRCEYYKNVPPEDDWDGSWTLKSK